METSILTSDAVEGIDVQKVRGALWLLAEAGMPRRAIENIKIEMGTSRCSHCNREWSRKEEQHEVLGMPAWEYKFERGKRPNDWTPANVRNKIENFINDTSATPAPPMRWNDARTCRSCTCDVANVLAGHVVKMPKKLFNAFCKTFMRTIECQKGYHGEKWNRTRNYQGYVALVNGLLQHIETMGNARALKSIIEAAHTLGML